VRAAVTVRHLLSHAGGLPAWRPFYKEATSPQEAERQLFAVGPDTAPGTRFVYSDIGFILLGKLVERTSGMTLARYDSARVFAPLSMTSTRYLPPTSWRARIAPTETIPGADGSCGARSTTRTPPRSGAWRPRRPFLHGEDLARFARMYLGGGMLDGRRVLSAETVAMLTRVQNAAVSRRALGWETPTGTNSGGTRLSPQAFGHTGFTGTSLWMDPTRGVFVVLLTNRVNPTRENRKIGAVRSALADALMAVMPDAVPSRPGKPVASRRRFLEGELSTRYSVYNVVQRVAHAAPRARRLWRVPQRAGVRSIRPDGRPAVPGGVSMSTMQQPDVMVNITPVAAAEVLKFMEAEGVTPEQGGLRVAVMPGGCSGFKYSLVIEDKAPRTTWCWSRTASRCSSTRSPRSI
jgi:hypothetical protein